MNHMYHNISITQKTLLSLVKSTMFDLPLEIVPDIDWDDLYQEAKDQAIAALIADCVPEEAGTKWKSANTRNIGNSIRYLYAQNELITIFRDNNIPLAILKGTSAAVYYPVPLNRTMGDIDFIVPQDLFKSACDLMINKGFTVEKESLLDIRHIEYVKGKFSFELHHHFSKDDLDIEQYIIDGFQNMDYRMIDKVEFPMLPKLANGLVLLAHIKLHLKVGLGLRQVIDWMMFVNKELDDTFWDREFREAVLKTGMYKLAITVTRVCQMYLGLSERITWCRIADEELCRHLLEDLFTYGNFGLKHAKGLLFEKTATNIHKKGFFQYVQTSCEKKYILYNRHKWIKPIFWLYQFFYLVIKSLKMKRSTRILSDMKQSNQRYDLLKALDIV